MRCSRASFWGQTGEERLLEREGLGGEEKGGCRCLHISLNMEPLCTNFLLSFWKVGSRLEAISRVLSPCWCELCRLWWPLPFRQEGGGLLRQHINGRGESPKGPWSGKFIKKNLLMHFCYARGVCIKFDLWTIFWWDSCIPQPAILACAWRKSFQTRTSNNRSVQISVPRQGN